MIPSKPVCNTFLVKEKSSDLMDLLKNLVLFFSLSKITHCIL